MWKCPRYRTELGDVFASLEQSFFATLQAFRCETVFAQQLDESAAAAAADV
jgi:hypothetical protein